MMEILDRYSKAVLYSSATSQTITEAVTEWYASRPRAILTGADLTGADLTRAILTDADLRGADLTRANLRGADLTRANLRGADLTGADLTGADLTRADLRGADLTGADLTRAILTGANLTGANLTDAVMPQGERWEQYLTEVVPALLTAGGRRLSEIACKEHWDCHSWDNCPMAAAFGISGDGEGPPLLQPRIREFVHYFDQRLIPMPEIVAESEPK